MLCEINPLIVTPDGEVKALDSKFTVDDNALYKHADIAEMRDVEAADPLEALAREKGVTYVKLDGEVGILGNGAGLVMSTLDVIALVGGTPANFCDLGGGGDAEGVVDALEVITRDPQVKSIFFNIFGGITRCDEVARGILAALERMTIEQPIVVRLDGTNAEEGRKVLADAAPRGPPRRGDDARRRASRGGAGAMSDWSARAEAYRNAPEQREGEDLDLIVALGGGLAHGARRRHRRRPRRPPAARRRPAGRQRRSRARDAAGRDLPRRGSPVRGRRLRPRRLADRAAPLRGHRRRGRRDGARRQRPRRRRGHALRQRGGRGGREAARPDPRPLVLRGGVARAARGRRARDRGRSRRSRSGIRSSSGSTARRRRTTTGRA